MTMTVFGIPNCTSVKKARSWLDAQGMAHVFHDFKKQGVPPERLDAWLQAVGWERLINRQGTSWRQLPPGEQAKLTGAAGARALALAQPSLIKRPVIEWPDGRITVAFTPEQW